MQYLHLKSHTVLLKRAAQLGSRGAWNSAEHIFFPLLMLVATPVFLHSLGARQYGQWMFLFTLSSLGGWAGMGMGAATIREVASAHEDGHRSSDYIRVALTIVLLGAVVVGILLISFFIFGGTQLFVQMGEKNELLPIILSAPLLITFDQIDSVISGALRGAERFGLVARLEIFSKTIIVLGCLLFAVNSDKLILLIVVYVALNFFRVVIKASAVASLFGVKSIVPTWQAKTASSLIGFGKWSFLQLIGSAIFASVDKLLVGSLLGADVLASYSVCLQLAQQVQSLPAAFGGFLFPYFTKRSLVLSNRLQARSLLVSTTFLSLMSFSILLPIAIGAHPLLNFWIGQDFAADSSTLLRFLAMGYFCLALPIAPHYFLYGTGQAKWVALSNIVAGVLSVMFCYILIPWYGVVGAAATRFLYGAVIIALFSWKLIQRINFHENT